MKPIILCADDYGVSQSIGEGIRQLVAARRLSAVSCLSTAPLWPMEAALLKPFSGRIDVGLHFNLTLGFSSPVRSLNSWIIDSLCGRIEKNIVEKALRTQLEQFEAIWGEKPAFIDGHQHVHIFPGIRGIIFRLVVERYPQAQRPWIRRVNPPITGHDAPFKALALRILSVGFSTAALQAKLLLTNGFAGLYSLSAGAQYSQFMDGWLQRASPMTLLMCHPGLSALEDPDGIGGARINEFQYLQSEEFAVLLKNEKVALVRFFGECEGA
jgi:chitin disaccharide deacetylase